MVLKNKVMSLTSELRTVLFAGLLGLLALTGCASVAWQTQDETCVVEAWRAGDLVIEPPQLFVSLNESEQRFRAISWHMGYGIHYKDGTIAGGAVFDSPHPSAILTEDFSASTLQLSHMQDIPIEWLFVGMDFTYGNPPSANPHIVSVTRWRAEYAAEACWYYGGETIELVASEGWKTGQIVYMIPVFDYGYDYIFVVKPRWQEGQIRWHSLFAFRISSGTHQELTNTLWSLKTLARRAAQKRKFLSVLTDSGKVLKSKDV